MSPVVPKPKFSTKQYEALLAAQEGRCAICRKRPGKIRLSLDHDHWTGRIRGLIHNRCNRALGVFEYSDVVLTGLMDYVLLILADHQAYQEAREKEVNNG